MSALRFTFSLLPALCLAGPAFAQVLPRTEPVVVTASRVAEPVADALAAVDVITREDIEASGSVDVLSLLHGLPGVDVVRGGSLGQQTSLFIRGTNSNHALVLIDGVRVSALGTGAYAWEHLPIAQIERIEVVRGPRAALWGADALGGVVQVFTRRGEGASADLMLGNHGTRGISAGLAQRGASGAFGVHAGWLRTDGQNATRPDNFSFDPDRDGAWLRNVSAWGELGLGGQTLELGWLHNDNEIEFDQGRSQTRQDVQSVALSGALADQWQHRLSLGANQDRLETPAFFTRYRSRREQADWQHMLQGPEGHEFNLGLSWLQERGRQIDTFSQVAAYEQSRHTRSAFASWRGRFGFHTLEVSGRNDDNSVYGSQTSLAAGWALDIVDGTRLMANWGEGFRAPTMNELYSPGFDGWYSGNPSLGAETSESLEIGLQTRTRSAGTWEGRAFRNRIDGLIDFSGPLAQAINIGRARIEGLELVWQWQGELWNLAANGTWQRPKNLDTGEALLRRPSRKATVLLERALAGGQRIGLEARAVARSTDFGDVALGGHGLLALRANWPLGPAWQLDLRVDNLLNRDYTLADGYHTPGTTALLSLRWRAPR